jgi:hypothetical protein
VTEQACATCGEVVNHTRKGAPHANHLIGRRHRAALGAALPALPAPPGKPHRKRRGPLPVPQGAPELAEAFIKIVLAARTDERSPRVVDELQRGGWTSIGDRWAHHNRRLELATQTEALAAHRIRNDGRWPRPRDLLARIRAVLEGRPS